MADAQPPTRRKRYSIVVSKASQVSLKDQLGLSESKESELGANHFALFTPAFKDIISDVENGLKTNFKSVEVKVLDKCPNLNEVFQPEIYQQQNKDNKDDKDNKNEQQQIYHELLRANGICGGTPVIVDVGGLPYLYTKKYHKKSYDLKDILEILNKKLKIKEETVAFIFGSAYADNAISSTGGEVIVNYKNNLNHHNKLCEIGPKDVKDISDANANINKDTGPATPTPELGDGDKDKDEEKKDNSPFDIKIGGVSCKKYESADQFGCKANLFICQGDNDGEVLYIKVKTRTGKESLIQCLRNALKKVKGCGDQDSQIGVGGIVKVKGKVKAYISPKWVEIDYKDKDAINKSREQIEIGPDLLLFTNFLTDDPSPNKNYHATMESTICQQLSHNPHEGGVFIESAQDDIIEYEGYFILSKYWFRIEDPYHNIDIENAKK